MGFLGKSKSLVSGLAVIFVLWSCNFLYFYVWVKSDSEGARAGQFGDSFGAINSLFAGIAAAFAVFGLYQQVREYRRGVAEAEFSNLLRINREAAAGLCEKHKGFAILAGRFEHEKFRHGSTSMPGYTSEQMIDGINNVQFVSILKDCRPYLASLGQLGLVIFGNVGVVNSTFSERLRLLMSPDEAKFIEAVEILFHDPALLREYASPPLTNEAYFGLFKLLSGRNVRAEDEGDSGLPSSVVRIPTERIISVVALVFSLVAFAMSFWQERNLAELASRPVITIEYSQEGWLIRNVGSGPAVDLIVAVKDDSTSWEHAVRVPPLAAGAHFSLPWLGHANIRTIGAAYSQLSGDRFSSICTDDRTLFSEEDVLAEIDEASLGKYWEAPLLMPVQPAPPKATE